MAKVNHSKFAILGLLSQEPMSGYDIKKEVAETLGSFWVESDGHLYPTLKKLVDDKWIIEKIGTKQDAVRNRKVYSITKLGEAALKEWLEEPVQPKIIRDELILKLFFGENADADVSISHLERSRQVLSEKVFYLEKIRKGLEKYKHDAGFFYWDITLDYGISTCKMKLDWCNRSIGKLNYKAKTKKRGEK